MKSAKNEEYKCYLPSEGEDLSEDVIDPGKPAEELLMGLFAKSKAGKNQCSYRLEVIFSKNMDIHIRI